MDGLGITTGGKVCDSSFNDFVTAKYLAEKNIFNHVYALTTNRLIVQDVWMLTSVSEARLTLFQYTTLHMLSTAHLMLAGKYISSHIRTYTTLRDVISL